MASEEVLILLIVMVVLTMLLGASIASQYKRVPPGAAMVVFGRSRGDEPFHIVGPGHARFIRPLVEEIKMVSLETHVVLLVVPDVTTKQGVPVTLDLVGIYRISAEPERLKRSVQMLLSKSQGDLDEIMQLSMAAHARGVAATLTVEEANADRDGFSKKVRALVDRDLAEAGLEVVALILKDFTDQVGYLEALGKQRTAEVKRNAIIAESAARRDAISQASEYDRMGQQVRFETDVKIAEMQKARDLKLIEFKAEVEAAKSGEQKKGSK